jgi:hypothetical protein
MTAWKRVFVHVAWSILLLGLPGVASPLDAQQAGEPAVNGPSATSQTPQRNIPATNVRDDLKAGELPDSPGAMLAKASDPVALQSSAEPRLTTPSSSGSSPSASPQAQAQSTPQRPVGTAAAESPHATGVAASQPAGVAIAPAKQHRVRTIVLRTGAIIGAGVAVGSVVALTAATPSKPPGAH